MERKELIARLRKDALEHKEVAHCCDCPPENTQNWKHMQTCLDAADMLEADVQPAVPQEPVGYVYWNKGHAEGALDNQLLKPGTPLYTAPQPRLTDEEIDSVPFNGFTDLRQRFESENECLRAFARAIEAKLRGERYRRSNR